jgi:hypothetical protein
MRRIGRLGRPEDGGGVSMARVDGKGEGKIGKGRTS